MNIPSFFLRGSARPNEALIASFGKLERAILNSVWNHEEVNVKQVVEDLEDRIAYTTAMTTLDRLFKKGLLDRRKVGKAYLYRAKFTPEQLESGVAHDVIGRLLDAGTQGAEPVLACIVDAVSRCDRDLLDRLEEMVQEKRRELEEAE